jgi:hypothetical protein
VISHHDNELNTPNTLLNINTAHYCLIPTYDQVPKHLQRYINTSNDMEMLAYLLLGALVAKPGTYFWMHDGREEHVCRLEALWCLRRFDVFRIVLRFPSCHSFPLSNSKMRG